MSRVSRTERPTARPSASRSAARRDLRAALPRHLASTPCGPRARAGSRSACPTSAARSRAPAPAPPPSRPTTVRVRAGDPPLGHHRRRFDREQRRARKRQVPEMDDVPVGRASLVGGVLAHRRDDDAVPKFQAADTDGVNRWAGISLRAESGDGIGRGETPCGHVDRDG